MKKILLIAALAFISCQKSTSKVSSNTLMLNNWYTFWNTNQTYTRKLNITYNCDTTQGKNLLVLEDGVYLTTITLKKPQETIDVTDLYSCEKCVTYYTFIFEHKDGSDEELGKFKTQ